MRIVLENYAHHHVYLTKDTSYLMGIVLENYAHHHVQYTKQKIQVI